MPLTQRVVKTTSNFIFFLLHVSSNLFLEALSNVLVDPAPVLDIVVVLLILLS